MTANYGSKPACAGAWKPPVPGSERIDPAVQAYYDRLKQRGRTPHRHAGWRAECAECGKLCALRANGSISAHVDNRPPPLSPEKREQRERRLALAQSDLLKLRDELKEDA